MTDLLKIFSDEDNEETCYLIESGTCVILDGVWSDSLIMYFLYFLFAKSDNLNFQD